MTTDNTFLPSDPAEAKHEIVRELYRRFNDVLRAAEQKYPIDDDFEKGIDCRLANEELWLKDLLEKIERS
jgi:hypothetical protein